MPRLVSLLCNGCISQGKESVLFDDDRKRSCYGKCHHSLCEQCVSRDLEQDCPICGEPKAFEHKTIDYAASKVYEEFSNRPIDIFRDWWNGESIDTGRCALCQEGVEDLRLCIGCELKLPQFQQCIKPIRPPPVVPLLPPQQFGIDELFASDFEVSTDDEEETVPIPIPVKNTNYEFRINSHTELLNFFSRVLCPDCLIDRHDEVEGRNMEKQRLKNEKFKRLTFVQQVMHPKPVVVEAHKKEKNDKRKLKDLKHFDDEMKRITFPIAKDLLWSVLHKIKQKEFCKLRKWRLFRTAELLIHYSYLFHRSPEKFINNYSDTHQRKLSKVNKFFKGIEYFVTENLSKNTVENLMKSVEPQIEEIKKIEKKCECTEIYEKMHDMKFGNPVDEIFVKMVEATDLEDVTVSGCLLRNDTELHDELQECYQEAEEMSKWKLHLIPSVMCFSKSTEICELCGIFDGKNKKPYKCRKCENSICSECWAKNAMERCPFCGSSMRNLNVIRSEGSPFTVNNELIELVEFYKRNCVDLYEKWWNSETIPFCSVCSSYSSQLEICAFCELKEKRSSLKCNADRNGDFRFKKTRLRSLLLRIQCSQCAIRLETDWAHDKCEMAQSGSQISIRGCNHLRYRLHNRRCRGYDVNADECQFSVIALNSIENSKYAWKLATVEIVHQILKSAVEELNICKLRKMRFSRILGNLKKRTYQFLSSGIRMENVESEEQIQQIIEILKFQWAELQGHENCRCIVLWDRGSSQGNEGNRKLFKNISNFRLNQQLEGCPLEFDHGFKESRISDDYSLEFENLWNSF